VSESTRAKVVAKQRYNERIRERFKHKTTVVVETVGEKEMIKEIHVPVCSLS